MAVLKPRFLTSEYLELLEEKANEVENPVIYLAIDPGKANGICGYDENCQLVFMHTVTSVQMIEFIFKFKKVKVCVIEDYKLFPNKAAAQSYSDMETSRVIGRVETWAEVNSVTLIKQKSDIKPNGYKWIGEKPLPKTNPLNHQLDAHVHFMYWGIKNGLISAASLL